MSNSNKHIEEFLDYYLNVEQSPDYAVLITGCWGSGKTYFIRQYLDSKGAAGKSVVKIFDWLNGFERYTVVYVSLFGAKNRDDINKNVERILHPKINSKNIEYLPDAISLVSNLAGIAVGTTVAATTTIATEGSMAPYAVPAGVATGSAFGNFFKNLFSKKKNKDVFTSDFIDEIKNKKKRLVVVFDDVERADMPLPELLGYLNEYVEHLHIPCILLADKDKWEEAQKCQEDKSTLHHLSSTKEKVIGKEFQIQTSFDEVWNVWSEFTHHPVGNRTWEIIKNLDNILHAIMIASCVNNYRALKHSLSDFQRLIGEKSNEKMFIKDEFINNCELVKLLFADFICHQYSYYLGDITPEDIPSDLLIFYAARTNKKLDEEENKHNEDEELDKYSKFEKKFELIPRISDRSHNGASIISKSSAWNNIWKKWLERSYVDSDEIMDLMKCSIFFDERNDYILNQLQEYNQFFLSDEEASKLWTELNEKFKKREFKNPNYVFTLFFQWLSLAYDEIAEKNIDELFADMKEYINEVIFDGSVFAGDQLPMNHEQLRNSDIAKELLNMIGAKCPYDLEAANKAVLYRLYCYMENPSENQDIPFTIRIEARFPFEKIDIPRFIDCYTKGEFKEERVEMCNCIASRFNKMKVQSPEQYKREITHLKEFEKEIDRILAQKPILPSKLALRRLKERIQQIVAI